MLLSITPYAQTDGTLGFQLTSDDLGKIRAWIDRRPVAQPA